ncbi:glucosamine-6-phosphate deaminase [Leifsonia sp. P73]|uniref:glucosamine-6-phosphate deaminase n=1 Tax=Leifsonia sp. P73 TaxID=3423959 RepID=UPI003DA4AE10
MRIVVSAGPEEAGEAAARLVLQRLSVSSGRVLGVATGSSPGPLYRALAASVRAGADLSDVRGFALDEYIGLPREHPQSYHSIVERDVAMPLGLRPEAILVPEGQAPDPTSAAAAYEAAIAAAGGIDVQILGIGTNGHIGFNEPGSPRGSRTRMVRLEESTRRANSRFFRSLDDVPTLAITQGVSTILEARSIVLIASGEAKASAVRRSVQGATTEDMPASLLQGHRDVTLFLDPAAASLLDRVPAKA